MAQSVAENLRWVTLNVPNAIRFLVQQFSVYLLFLLDNHIYHPSIPGLLGVLALYLVQLYGAQPVCYFIGIVYPIYASIKAIDHHGKDENTKWLTYWVIYGSISIAETFADSYLYSLPFYWFIKCCVLGYCMAPTSWNGAYTLYHRGVHPIVLKYEERLYVAVHKASNLINSENNGTQVDRVRRPIRYLFQRLSSGLSRIITHPASPGVPALLALYLMMDYGARSICSLVIFLYPAYLSIKAIEVDNKKRNTKWLTYWVVYAIFGLPEYFASLFLHPAYWVLKCCFLGYCMAPWSWNGSYIMYNYVICLVLHKCQGRRIDAVLNKAADVIQEVILTLLALFLVMDYGPQLVCNFIGFLYPTYGSIKAIENHDKDETTKWLTYWVIYTCVSLLEFYVGRYLFSVPFYWTLKCVFFGYCMAPMSWNGSLKIYNRVIRLARLMWQDKLASALQKLKESSNMSQTEWGDVRKARDGTHFAALDARIATDIKTDCTEDISTEISFSESVESHEQQSEAVKEIDGPDARPPVTRVPTDVTTTEPKSTTGGSKPNVNSENISEEISFSDSVEPHEQQSEAVKEIDGPDACPPVTRVPTDVTTTEPTSTPGGSKPNVNSENISEEISFSDSVEPHEQQSEAVKEIDGPDSSPPVTRVPTDVTTTEPKSTTGGSKPNVNSENISKEISISDSTGSRGTDSAVSSTTSDPTGSVPSNSQASSDCIRDEHTDYPIGNKRLAVFVGIDEFLVRGIDGSGDIDPTMNRPEVKIDKWNMQTTMETLGFTFRSNIFVQGEKPKTTKAEVDQFIKDVIKEAGGMDIIVLIISTHGEDVVENKVVRHRILLLDSHIYTDDLLSQFENHHQIREIPKLFFIQACRSRPSGDENDNNDLGVEIAVQAYEKMQQGTNLIQEETHKQEARPRNVKKSSGMSRDPVPMVPSQESKQVSVPEDDWTQNKDPGSQFQSMEIETSSGQSEAYESDVGPTSKQLITTIVEPGSPTEIQSIRCIPHSLVMYASAPGKFAYRGSINGGWLIYALSEGLKEWSQTKRDEDMLQVLTRIVWEISTKQTSTGRYTSAACFSHRCDEWYLNKECSECKYSRCNCK